MPELPEVETMKNALAPHMTGKKIQNVTLTNEKIISIPDPDTFVHELNGRTVDHLERRGKYIIIDLGEDLILVAHMRMTGRLFTCSDEIPEEKHTHLNLDMGEHTSVRYVDPRRFGRFWFGRRDEIYEASGINKLGLEPNDSGLTTDYILNYLKRRKKAIKSCLLDQNFIAGIGNIYADEILFNCGIHPARPANLITEEEAQKLSEEIPKVINENIELCRVTADEFFKDKTNTYRNGDNIRIYNHGDEPCPVCQTPLEKTTIGQRTSTFCPKCQK